MKVHFTIDFYLRHWDDDQKGELWMCYQPHIERADRPDAGSTMGDWVDALRQGATPECVLVDRRPGSSTPERLVPVNLPSLTDVRIELLDASGSPIDGLDKVSVPRTTANEVLDPSRFREQNAGPPRPQRPGQKGLPEPAPAPTGAFATSYNVSLAEQWDATVGDDPTPDSLRAAAGRLADSLVLGFWGGVTRRFDAQSLRPGEGSEAFLMSLDRAELRESEGEQTPVTVTNLQSLCGLMARVATRAQIGLLDQVERFRVTIQSPDGVQVLEPADDASRRAVRSYFSGLDAITPAPLRAEWSRQPTLNDRVYVEDDPIPFVEAAFDADGAVYYRRRRERRIASMDLGKRNATEQNPDGESDQPGAQSDWSPKGLRLGDLRKLVVYPETPEDAAGGIPEHIEWKLFDSVEASLKPAIAPDSATDAPRLLVVAPIDAERAKIDAEVSRAQQGGPPTWPNTVKIYDAGGKPMDAIEYVGPQPAPGRGYLFYGKADLGANGGGVTLLIDRETRLLTSARGTDDSDGPRWVLERHDFPVGSEAVEFDVLRCASTPDGADDWRLALVPTISTRDGHHFRLANSSRSVEGVLEVKYPPAPHADPNDPDSVRAADEYLDDLINHNKLNVFHTWGAGAREHLNPWQELLPLRATGGEGEPRAHEWRVNYEIPNLQPDAPGASLEDAPGFFRDVYANLGRPRRLDWNVEHTYGVRLRPEADTELATPTWADFPPQNPAAVSVTTTPENAPPEREYFLTVRLEEPAEGVDRAHIRCRTGWLASAPEPTPDDKGVDEAGRRVAAWRSIAELANAQRVILRARAVRFDRLAKMGANAPVATDTLLAEYLADVYAARPAWDVTETVGRTARAWMDSPPTDPVFAFDPIDLPTPDASRLGDLANLVEFSLEIHRPERAVPPREKADEWQAVRPVPVPLVEDPEGGPDPVFSPDISLDPTVDVRGFNTELAEWIDELRTSAVTLAPDADAHPNHVERVARVIGSGGADSAEGWIIPERAATPENRRTSAVVCPVTFLPITPRGPLGPGVFTIAKRFVRTLDVAKRGEIAAWSDPAAAQDPGENPPPGVSPGRFGLDRWRAHTARVDALAPALDTLVERMIALLRAAPDAREHSSVAPAAKKLAARLRAPAHEGTGGPLWRAVSSRVAALLRADLTLFADAKSFLVTEFSGVAPLDLPRMFFRFETTKLIRPATSTEPALFTESDELGFREVLKDGSNEPSTFIEVLDDTRYDNDFQIPELPRAFSFETVMDQIRTGEPNPPGEGDIEVESIVTPAGTDENFVRLAAREPVAEPVHIHTGHIARFTEPVHHGQPRTPLTTGERVDLEELLSGDIADPKGAAARVIAASDGFAPTQRIDDFVLSAIFAVTGDEERLDGSPSADIESIKYDAWSVSVYGEDDADGWRPKPWPAHPTRLSPPTFEVLKELLDKEDPQELSALSLQRILTPRTITEVASLLEPPKVPTDAIPEGLPEIRLDPTNPGRLTITGASPNAGIEAALLVPEAIAGTAPPPPGNLLLVINARAPVWRRSAIAVLQTRNTTPESDTKPGRSLAGLALDPRFEQVSDPSHPGSLHRPNIERLLTEVEPVELDDAPYTLRELISQLLIERQDNLEFLPPSVGRRPWEHHALTITRAYVARTQMMGEYPGFSTDEPVKVTRGQWDSRFPVAPPVHAGAPDWDLERADWFPDKHAEYAFDFQWVDENNSPILRFSDVRVIVKGRSDNRPIPGFPAPE